MDDEEKIVSSKPNISNNKNFYKIQQKKYQQIINNY